MHVNCLDRIKQLEQPLEDKESELKAKNCEISELQTKYQLERFGATRSSFDDDMIEFYTGFPTYNLFFIFFSAMKKNQLQHE